MTYTIVAFYSYTVTLYDINGNRFGMPYTVESAARSLKALEAAVQASPEFLGQQSAVDSYHIVPSTSFVDPL